MGSNMRTVIPNNAPCCAVFYFSDEDTIYTFPVAAWVVDPDVTEPGVPLIAYERGLIRIGDYDGDGLFAYIEDGSWSADRTRIVARLRELGLN